MEKQILISYEVWNQASLTDNELQTAICLALDRFFINWVAFIIDTNGKTFWRIDYKEI